MLESLVAIVISIIIGYILFTSNYTNMFSYIWVLATAIVLVGIGKFFLATKANRSTIGFYWNMAFFILALIAAYLLTVADLTYAHIGAYLFIFLAIADIAFTAYDYYMDTKASPKTLDTNGVSKMPMIATALVVVGDLLFAGSFIASLMWV
jgi:uncharacterized membrane protein HdeD (DUF308 family)